MGLCLIYGFMAVSMAIVLALGLAGRSSGSVSGSGISSTGSRPARL